MAGAQSFMQLYAIIFVIEMQNIFREKIYTNFRGRITPAQKSALEKYSDLYNCNGLASLEATFLSGRYTSVGLEIGFGMGVWRGGVWD